MAGKGPDWDFVIFHGSSSVDSFDTRHHSKSAAKRLAADALRDRRERWRKAYGSDDGGEWKIVEYHNGERTGNVYKVR